MKYVSTRGQAPTLPFDEVLLTGLARDGGLYLPTTWPKFSNADLKHFSTLTYAELAIQIMTPFIGKVLSHDDVSKMVKDTYRHFQHPSVAPLKQLDQNHWLLELFHGPTLAFKDYPLQLVGRLFDYVLRKKGQKVTILGATSGDTGSAAIEACRDKSLIEVFMLHPAGRVSDVQRRQMTTVQSDNIHNIALEGTFDDCQSLVKQGFLDKELRSSINITSANSINISRLIPQTFYYFWAVIQLVDNSKKVFSVPSGNFGNVAAAIIAKKMGLPIDTLIASTNSNDVVPNYLKNYQYIPKHSIQTLSNAMDVGDPSNIKRINKIYNNNPKDIWEDMHSWGFSDSETLDSIRNTYQKFNYIVDPHTAVGILGYKKYINEISKNQIGVILSTAHPAKFKNVIEEHVDFEIPIPNQLKEALAKDKISTKIGNSYNQLKEFIKSI